MNKCLYCDEPDTSEFYNTNVGYYLIKNEK
jgi:hypothetical protein